MQQQNEQYEVIDTKLTVWEEFHTTIISRIPIEYEHLPVRMDVNCPNCKLEGQYHWQTPDKLRLEFYCPCCNITWTVFKKEIKRKD